MVTDYDHLLLALPSIGMLRTLINYILWAYESSPFVTRLLLSTQKVHCTAAFGCV